MLAEGLKTKKVRSSQMCEVGGECHSCTVLEFVSIAIILFWLIRIGQFDDWKSSRMFSPLPSCFLVVQWSEVQDSAESSDLCSFLEGDFHEKGLKERWKDVRCGKFLSLYYLWYLVMLVAFETHWKTCLDRTIWTTTGSWRSGPCCLQYLPYLINCSKLRVLPFSPGGCGHGLLLSAFANGVAGVWRQSIQSDGWGRSLADWGTKREDTLPRPCVHKAWTLAAIVVFSCVWCAHEWETECVKCYVWTSPWRGR